MKKLMEKVCGTFGLFEPETEFEEEQEEFEAQEDNRHNRKDNVVTLPTSQKQVKVMVIEPLSFDEARQVADYLKARRPVVVNFESTDTDIAKRMVDFVSGTTYALDGTIKKVGNDIFLCTPSNIGVTMASQEDGSTESYLPWNK